MGRPHVRLIEAQLPGHSVLILEVAQEASLSVSSLACAPLLVTVADVRDACAHRLALRVARRARGQDRERHVAENELWVLHQRTQLRLEHRELHVRVVLRLADVPRRGPLQKRIPDPRGRLLDARARDADASAIDGIQLHDVALSTNLLR